LITRGCLTAGSASASIGKFPRVNACPMSSGKQSGALMQCDLPRHQVGVIVTRFIFEDRELI
jgi:hypothetical protein